MGRLANATKVVTIPAGTRADRLQAILTALEACEDYTHRLTVRALSTGELVVYRHQWGQS